jgi:hypothetical protein
LGFSTFEPKKFPENPIPGDPFPVYLRRRRELPAILDLFFQLSRRNFFNFLTFNRKIFWFFKFQTENFPIRECSIPKNPGGRNFSARVPGSIGCAGICRGSRAPSEGEECYGYFPGFACKSAGNFWGLRTFAQENTCSNATLENQKR